MLEIRKILMNEAMNVASQTEAVSVSIVISFSDGSMESATLNRSTDVRFSRPTAHRLVVSGKAVSIEEAAKRLTLSRSSLYRLLSTNQIKSVKIGAKGKSGRRMIPESEISEFLSRNSASGV